MDHQSTRRVVQRVQVLEQIARHIVRGGACCPPVGMFDARRERTFRQSCIECGVWGVRLNGDGECKWCEMWDDLPEVERDPWDD